MRRRTLIAGATAGLALPGLPGFARAGDDAQMGEVDTLLVLATDVSRSMDEEEGGLQREGTLQALRHPVVLDAIQGGMIGAIGLCYLEWSGLDHQSVVVPWQRIAAAADIEGFADSLEARPVGIGIWTSISAALERARDLLDLAPFAARRRVIDVSGDGPNNAGEAPEAARDLAVARGIIINGLPVMRGGAGHPTGLGSAVPLDQYDRDSVVGGFGAFVLPVAGFRDFALAIRRKLVMEIAAAPPPAGPA